MASYTPLGGAPKSWCNFIIVFTALAGIVTGVALLVHYSSSTAPGTYLHNNSSNSSTGALLTISSSSSSSSTGSAASCLSIPPICQNNATCTTLPIAPYYNCTCTAGFNTTNCSGRVNYCDSNPCAIGINPGSITCTSIPGPVANYTCGCATGYNTIGYTSPCYLPFLSIWNTSATGTSNSNQITLPLVSFGTYNAFVDWGDGTLSTLTSYFQFTHTYSTPGIYTVNISGIFTGFAFANGGDKLKLSSITQFGSLSFAETGGQFFQGCANLRITATDTLNLAGITSLKQAFAGCSSLTTIPSANTWNTQAITNMMSMFNGAGLFNQPIGNWNVSSVTTMASMFQGAASFNQSIGNWNTGAVTVMASMFNGATAFNQPIGNWNTSLNTDISNMFLGSVFNQPIGTWNTASVLYSNAMFFSAPSFNQPLGNWKMNKNVDMSGMFWGASSFNQPLGTWNTAAVTTMTNLFHSATSFNQSLSSWNVSSVLTMASMFFNAVAFDQNIGSWDIRHVTSMSFMFSATLSKANYNALLVGWQSWDSFAPPKNLTRSVVFSAGTSVYSCAPDPAAYARGNLTSVDLWTITDGGCL